MKQKDKIALLEFDALIKEIRQATPILNLNETEQQKQARIKNCLVLIRNLSRIIFQITAPQNWQNST